MGITDKIADQPYHTHAARNSPCSFLKMAEATQRDCLVLWTVSGGNCWCCAPRTSSSLVPQCSASLPLSAAAWVRASSQRSYCSRTFGTKNEVSSCPRPRHASEWASRFRKKGSRSGRPPRRPAAISRGIMIYRAARVGHARVHALPHDGAPPPRRRRPHAPRRRLDHACQPAARGKPTSRVGVN